MSDLDNDMLARIGNRLSANATNGDLLREFGINKNLAAKCVAANIWIRRFSLEIYHVVSLLFWPFLVSRLRSRHQSNEPLTGKAPHRPPALSSDSITAAAEEVRGGDMALVSLDSVSINRLIDKMRLQEIVANNGNNLVVLPPLDRKTRALYVARIAPDTIAQAQSRSATRAKAAISIQNPISVYAMWKHFAHIHPALQLNIDALAVQLGKGFNDKPKVFVAAGTKDYLRSLHISPGTVASKEDRSVCRFAYFLVAHNARGQQVHCATLIKDKKFVKLSGSMLSPALSVWLVPPAYDKYKFFRLFIRKCVGPHLEEIRRSIVKLRERVANAENMDDIFGDLADESDEEEDGDDDDDDDDDEVEDDTSEEEEESSSDADKDDDEDDDEEVEAAGRRAKRSRKSAASFSSSSSSSSSSSRRARDDSDESGDDDDDDGNADDGGDGDGGEENDDDVGDEEEEAEDDSDDDDEDELWRQLEVVITIDGEHEQICATQNEVFAMLCQRLNFQFAKWCKASSALQQPADAGRQHMAFKAYWGSAHYNGPGEPSDEMAEYIRLVFNKCKMPKKSKDVFRKLLGHLESALNSAFSIKNLQKSWRMTGLQPFSREAIFSRFLGWPQVPQADAEKIFAFVFQHCSLILTLTSCSLLPSS
jgi:hypothetical protein